MMAIRGVGITFKSLIVIVLTAIIGASSAMVINNPFPFFSSEESKTIVREVAPLDTLDLPWPNQDHINPQDDQTGVSLPLPENIQYEIIYDAETGQYQMVQTVGGLFNYRNPTLMTLDEYMDYQLQENVSEYWDEIQDEEDAASRSLIPALSVGGEGFKNFFGSNEIEIRPQGSAELTFGVNISKTDNPRIPERQRRIATFDFDQRIQLNVVGKIGTKMELATNYNTEATFDFENQMNLGYEGEEDEILKNIEAGNVSMPLPGTLITGSQSLFGLKLETQFGRMFNTTVFSQQKGERKEIQVEGGAQTQLFEIQGDNYDANRHYFLSNWFRDQYDVALQSLPVVNSGVNITRIEVWVVNQQANTQNVRNLVAFADMGEHMDYFSPDILDNPAAPDWFSGSLEQTSGNPSNLNNIMHGDYGCVDFNTINAELSAQQLAQGLHYERVGNARMLSPSEYTYNSRLGFISLRQALNNAEVLAVSYEYTLQGETYKIGTLSQDGCASPDALGVKLLKSSVTNVHAPLWDLMMKNVYNIGAFGVESENFRLDVWYNNPSTGVDQNYIARTGLDDKLLIQVLSMDQIDVNQMPFSDGIFDYVDNAAISGGLIHSQNGRIYFPTVEPFGDHLEQYISDHVPDADLAANITNSIVYSELYDSTKTAAQQIPSKNRFKIRGQFQSSSGSEISLNALNVPQGSVSVTSGGVKLVENIDYTVDYNLGRVRIINEGILQSGAPINISLESNSLFNIQTKTMIGSRFDYKFSDNFNVGATMLNLKERPLTQKVNIGDEPVNNTILGADLAYQTKSEWLTRLVDAIPGIDTKAESSIDISAEGAFLIPGHSRAIGKDGNAYLDDFEGSQSTIDIRSVNQWFLASTPKLQQTLFPEGNFEDSLVYGYNRGKLSWYVIDPLFYRDNSLTPINVDEVMRSDNRMREVLENEVFPNKELPAGTPPNIPTLDLTYHPEQRGQYNYDLPDGSAYSAGLEDDGSLKEPDTRWGGIQRSLTTTDFESSNIEFIQFWLMDPFNQDSENISGGDLYFNLGNVSEDVLNDSQLSFENGYPTDNQDLPVLESTWGVFPDPSTFNVVNAFDNSLSASLGYSQQDVGIDGLNSQQERAYFGEWLAEVEAAIPDGFAGINADPSADDFGYFRGGSSGTDNLSTIEKYGRYNGYEGNSNTKQPTPDGFPITATTIPNTEDINQDLTLNTIESYYQYHVSLRQGDLGENNIGSNYISDSFVANLENLPDGNAKSVRWYQFKIPVKEFEKRVGGIQDFRSIRYIRMFVKGFAEPVTLRFARLELVRGEWRRYDQSLEGPQELEPGDPEPTTFNISAVNIEENGNREPVNYVIPPGIIREIDVGTANLRNLNEQSLELEVCNLADGDARAAYRNVNFDMRMYKKLKMFVHVEDGGQVENLGNNNATCFLRLGSDFDENYYEYELPLKVTTWGETDDNNIWFPENQMEIELKKLQNLKIQRPSGYSALNEFVQPDAGSEAILKVKGNPNLANVIVVMVGVRNPDKDDNQFASIDDGQPICPTLWVNELRLTDFNEQGGWAAVARLNANLADFGTFQIAGNMSTPGFGTLEQRVQERQRETVQGIDANSTLKLDKFFPESLGVQLPMYVGYSETITTPQFDPLSPDLEVKDLDFDRSRKKKTQNLVRIRSINFTNVKIAPQGKGKNKGKGKDDKGGKAPGKGGGSKGKGGGSKFYDPGNFSVSYAYNERYQRDINLEFLSNKNYRGSINYTFSNRPKEIKPFAKIGFIKKSPHLKFIKDINFIPGIKQLSINTEMDRTYETSRVRNNTAELFGIESDVLIQTQVMKTWNWARQYTFKYDLTKSIKFDFNANSLSLVTEPQGVIDREDKEYWDNYKEEVWSEIQNLGENTNYNHNVNLSYKLPLDKFPLINFISADARYAGTYRWDRAPFTQDSLGHTIQNSRNLTLNAQANFLNLYNKVDLLKELNSNSNKKGGRGRTATNEERDGFGNIIDEKEEESNFNPFHEFLRLLMTVRNVSGTYSRNEGIILPGFGGSPDFAGYDMGTDVNGAPGWQFLAGHQYKDFDPEVQSMYPELAVQNGWLNTNSNQNQQYSETFSENWNLRANLEPIKHFKIEITANKQEARNRQSFFRFDEDLQDFLHESEMQNGNFSASIITWGTAFIDDDADFNSPTFRTFLDSRIAISERLNDQSFNDATALGNGYYDGWGPTSQQVVIPAFIAAYTGVDANSVSLDAFNTKVQPNWRVTYDGLTKNKKLKKYFKQFSVSHTYRSTFSTQYVTNLDYQEDDSGLPVARDESDFANFVSPRMVQGISISEQMSPLVGFDMTIKTAKKNDPQIKIEWRKDRNVNLSLANFQITETKSNALVIGIGYKFTEVPNPFMRRKGSKLPIAFLENTQLDIRCDLTIRDNVTLIRKMVEHQNQVTAGQKLISIKTSADMKVSDKLTLRFFYDHQLTRPKISTSFPTSNINSGISLRFTLSQ